MNLTTSGTALPCDAYRLWHCGLYERRNRTAFQSRRSHGERVATQWLARDYWTAGMMNVEEIREYCLSLGSDVEEKLPFVKFKNGEGVLVFYVCGHMFCFFDLNDFQVISLKCQPERIDEIIVPSRLRTEGAIRLYR